MQGILLVGHGTQEAVGVREFLALAKQVADARPQVAVEPCFLEIADPPIVAGVSRLVERGVEEIVVMPLLLFAAGHAKHDVPQSVTAALQPFPHISWAQASHLGCHPAILQQSSERFAEAVRDQARRRVSPRLARRLGEPPLRETSLVFVGRGSHDEQATQEMHRFASLAPQSASVATVEVCFFAMAQPSLGETLKRVATASFGRVIVQPHLLFDGLLLTGIRKCMAECAAKHQSTEWLVADPLGPTAKVTQAVLERIDNASQLFIPTRSVSEGIPGRA